MFKNHLKRMLIFMAVVGLAGWLYALTLPKIYEATVDVRAGSPAITLDPTLATEVGRAAGPLLQPDLDTDAGILRSQRIFGEALVRAGEELREPSLATSQTLVSLFPMYEVTVPGAINQYAASQQRIIQVKVRAFSPQAAAAIANSVGVKFTEYRRDSVKTAVAEVSRDLRKSLQKAKAEAARLEAEYGSIKRSASVADVGAKLEGITSGLEGLRAKRDDTVALLASRRSETARLEGILRTTPKTVEAAEQTTPDTAVDIAKSEASQARQQYEALLVTYQDDAPLVVDALRSLRRAEKRLADAQKRADTIVSGTSRSQNPLYVETQRLLTQSRAQEAGFVSQLAEYDAAIARRTREAAEAPKVEVDIQRILRDRENNNDEIQKLTRSLANFEGESSSNTIQLLAQADAETIKEPVAPQVRRWAILSLFAGALLGLAYSFAVESLRLPVHTSWQLAELTALPVAAAVPAIPKPLARRHEAAIREGTFKPIESFRYMAFSLLARETKPKTVLFAGVGGDVGASSAAAEFAVATARTGAKTILVDCDLRTPQLSGLFGLQGRTGVSDILGRTVLGNESTDLLVPTEHEGLMVLPAGTSIEAGLADFQTSHLRGLLDELAARADLVVLDLPAVDIYSDAARLAQYVDEACLVVSAKTTSYRSIPMAQEIMEKAGAKSMSIVLTNASSNDEPFGTRVSDSLVRA